MGAAGSCLINPKSFDTRCMRPTIKAGPQVVRRSRQAIDETVFRPDTGRPFGW